MLRKGKQLFVCFLACYVLFNSISVIPERWEDGNEKLCATETRLRLKRLPSPGIKLRTATSAGLRLIYLPVGDENRRVGELFPFKVKSVPICLKFTLNQDENRK